MNRLTAAFLTGLILLGSAAAIEAATLTRTSAFEYDATSGLLTKEIIEPDSPNLCLVTTYTYDPYGNKTASTTRNCNGSSGEAAAPTGDAVIQPRTSSTGYDAQGRFPTSSNALGHSETRVYDPRFGKPTQLTGPNGLTTTWAYDGFGRKTQETRSDGTSTSWSYLDCDSTCPSDAKYFVQTLSTGAPETRTYHDAHNREIRSATVGFDGRWVNKDTEYNANGQVARVSRPYYSGDAAHWTSSAYDEIGRPYQIEDADGTLTQISYSGLTTHTTNPKGQTKTETKNSQGQLIRVADANNYTTTFSYDAFGNLTQTRDPNGNQIVNSYDLRGRKTGMNDPDMGNWSYAYNALGELIRQTDAKNQTVSNTYDKLGRLTQRSEPDLITTWHYDQYKNGSACAVGIGKLCEIAADNGMGQRIYYEGQAGRISVVFHTIDTVYAAYRSYDAQGRADTQSVNAVFATRNVYNPYGYLYEVRRDSDNSLLWRADRMDAEGRVTKETLGNGVTGDHVYNAQNGRLTSIQANGPNGNVQNQSYAYDSIGNLSSRSDTPLASNESYTYDDLNRLTGATKNGISVTVQYDALGNITHKSDVGAYTYGRLHGVTKAGTNNYTYDANGNQLSGAGRSNTWTSYNLPSQIVESTGTTTFLYDYNHVRAKQTSPGKTVIYLNPRIDLGGHYNKETAGSIVTESYYFYAGGQVVGAYITKTNASAQTNYFHADHLGSISVVTNATGQVIARYAYDAWGKRTLASGSSATIHGFTGHEHLDDGLIHMNGRVYDPVLGRFLSADPIIQDPTNLQSYNRYSYVLNNPLFYTDPSGYSWWTKFRDKILKPVVAVAAAWVAGPMVFNAMLPSAVGAAGATGLGMSGSLWAGTAIAGAASGAVVGGITGGIFNGSQGILQGAKYGAIGGAIMGPVAAMYSGSYNGTLNGPARYGYSLERVTVQSAAGGVSSMAQGRSFLDGLKSSFIPSALTYMALSMRAGMVDSSGLYVDRNGVAPNLAGDSVGVMGDGYKIGGSRLVLDGLLGTANKCDSPLGGCQGGAGRIFGMQYGAGSWQDRLVEAYAGPHDALNSSYWYNNLGNGINRQGLASAFGEVLNGLNVIPASVFAGASVVQPYNYSAVFGR